MKIDLYLEMNPATDEWAGEALGLFLPSGFCLLGVHARRVMPGSRWEEWQFGLIILNFHAGFSIRAREEE